MKYPKSMLNKLYGFHSVKIYQLKMYVIVLGNVFKTPCEIHEYYDLKVCHWNFVHQHPIILSPSYEDIIYMI